MQITDGMVEAAIRAMEDSQGFIAPATPRYMRMALEAALSHAAGQEVEIPHPLGERHAAIEKALKGQTLLLMSRDHVNDQKKPLAEIKFGMSTDLGVLFCLADTEAPMPVDPAVARSEGEVEQMDRVYNFLMGISDLGGLSFGEKHPAVRGSFWWRHDLAAAYAPFRKAIASSGMGGEKP